MEPTPESPHLMNVLIVDDNEDAADSLGIILRVWGYGIRVAYDGEKALEAASASPPDCILLDINMPRMDGFAVAERIRQRPAMQGVKLVALTAYWDENRITRIAQAGFNYYLNKSCKLSAIRNVLENYCASKHATI